LYYIVLYCIIISMLPLCGEIKITNKEVRKHSLPAPIYTDIGAENNSCIGLLRYWRTKLWFGCISVLQKCGKIFATGAPSNADAMCDERVQHGRL